MYNRGKNDSIHVNYDHARVPKPRVTGRGCWSRKTNYWANNTTIINNLKSPSLLCYENPTDLVLTVYTMNMKGKEGRKEWREGEGSINRTQAGKPEGTLTFSPLPSMPARSDFLLWSLHSPLNRAHTLILRNTVQVTNITLQCHAVTETTDGVFSQAGNTRLTVWGVPLPRVDVPVFFSSQINFHWPCFIVLHSPSFAALNVLLHFFFFFCCLLSLNDSKKWKLRQWRSQE